MIRLETRHLNPAQRSAIHTKNRHTQWGPFRAIEDSPEDAILGSARRKIPFLHTFLPNRLHNDRLSKVALFLFAFDTVCTRWPWDGSAGGTTQPKCCNKRCLIHMKNFKVDVFCLPQWGRGETGPSTNHTGYQCSQCNT